jgi:hypothetical protein
VSRTRIALPDQPVLPLLRTPDLNVDVHGHPYQCVNVKRENTGELCAARMQLTAVTYPGDPADYWEVRPHPGSTPWEDLTWYSPYWSSPEGREWLTDYRAEERKKHPTPQNTPLPPGPVTNWDIPGFAGQNAVGWMPTTRPHRWRCPDPDAPVLPHFQHDDPPRCCNTWMRLAPSAWICRVDKNHREG